MKPVAERAVVVGVGLIGASLAAAARRAGAISRVTGVGRSRANLDAALAAGLVDEVTTDLSTALADADLVVLAAPADTCVDLLAEVAVHAPPTCVVTDVASIKAPMCAAAARAGLDARFVGAHPMAGGTAGGAEAADPDLFRGCVTVLTAGAATGRSARETVATMWTAVGARLIDLTPEAHDHAVAMASHLPQMLAFALCAAAARDEAVDDVLDVAGAGFRDGSRLALSPTQMWLAIASANRDELLASMDAFSSVWSELRAGVERGDAKAIGKLMDAARALKLMLEHKGSGS